MKPNTKTLFTWWGISMVMVSLALAGCGPNTKTNGPDLAALTQQGSNALGANDPASAKAAFQKIVNADPNNCNGQWGMVLADLQDASGNGIQIIINSIMPAVENNNLAGIFTGVTGDLSDIPSRTATIESRGCEFTLPSLPVNINPDLSSLSIVFNTLNIATPIINISFAFGTQWGPAEARVIGSMANSLLAAINMLSAHQLAPLSALTGVIGQLGSLNLSSAAQDPIGLIRSLGPILNSLPTLLTFSDPTMSPADIKAAGKEINASMSEMSGINDSLQLDKGNTAKVISYNDVNGDNVVDGGDTFTVGALYYTNSTWVNMIHYITGSESITVPARISSNAVPAAKALLTVFIGNLTSGTPDFKPTDVNDLMKAVGLTAYTFTSDVISLNPSALFANPVPLRNFFPSLSTASQVQIEAEAAASFITSATPWYYKGTDSTHFTDGTHSIVADGISVPASAADLFDGSLLGMSLHIPPMIPYISFNDPTFGGVLSIDLSQMLKFCEPAGTCPAVIPAGFNAATNYSLDKIIAGGIYGIFTDSTTRSHYTSENPDW